MIENRLQKMDLSVTVSLQEKGGIYQAVLSYKDLSDKWKTKWKSTSVKVKPGNKKLAKEKAELIKDKFEQEMYEKLRPKRTGIEELKEETFMPETYNMQELNKLLKIIKNDVIEIPVLLAAYYGLRRSEAVGLKWSAIDFDNDCLYINHTVVQVSGCANKLVEGKLVAKDRTKSIHSNRKLPLYKEVKDALLEKKRQIELNKQLLRGGYNQNYLEYVCVKDDGDIIKPNHITHRFLKIIRRNKLKEIRFHDLRHTIVTELNANGVDLKAIGEFLGHGNLSTTKRYAHPDERIKQNVMETYEQLISNGDKTKKVENENKPKRFIVKRKKLNTLAKAI